MKRSQIVVKLQLPLNSTDFARLAMSQTLAAERRQDMVEIPKSMETVTLKHVLA